MQLVAMLPCDSLHAAYVMEVPIYKADIFVDETDTDRMMH
jgi:hypothetical protein